jgi:hypothetical protein
MIINASVIIAIAKNAVVVEREKKCRHLTREFKMLGIVRLYGMFRFYKNDFWETLNGEFWIIFDFGVKKFNFISSLAL